MKVALVAPGHPFKIALDISSKRKLATIVGFDEGERRFGNEARSLITKRPLTLFSQIGTLLGKSMDTEILEEFKAAYFPYEFVEDEERSTIRIKMGDSTFSIEEIVAMYLGNAQATAVFFLESETPIRDCVITVPDFFTTKERNALLDAASLAGLNVLDLMNENSAAALYYGIERVYDVNQTDTFIIYNMGGSSTKVAVVEYGAWTHSITKRKNKTIGQVHVLSHGWDETLGGNAFDNVIMEKARAVAEEQLGTTLSDKPRAMARLRVAAEKAKRVLSANKQTFLRVTSLWDDKDISVQITRDDFVKDSKSLLDRVFAPMDIALERSGKTKEEIDGIVLMGGSSRIPKIQEMLHEYLGKELKKDLNTDEAAALGAAFRAANESTQFQVRKIGFVDTSPFTVHATNINNFVDYEASLEDDSIDLTELFHKQAEVFESGHILKRRKSVSFKHDQDLYVSLSHGDDDPLPSGTKPHIDHYNVSGIERAVKDYSEKNITDPRPNIRLSFLSDGSGIVKLAKAVATFQENVEVAIPRVQNTTETDKKKKRKKKGKKSKGAEDGETKEEGKEDGEETNEDGKEDATEEEGEEKTDENVEEETTQTEDKDAEEEEVVEKNEEEEEVVEKNEEEEVVEKNEEEETETEDSAEEAGAGGSEEDSPDSPESAEESSEETEETAEETKTDSATSGEEENAAEEKKETEESTIESEAGVPKNDTKPVPPKIEYDYEWKVKKRKVTLKIRSMGSDIRPLTKAQKKDSATVLMELDEADRAIRATAHAFNDLEAYILEHRPMLYEDEDEFVMQVSEEETREEFIALLTETEDWLYDEEEPSAGKFKAKLRELQKLVNPIFARAYELSNRDKGVQWGKDQIVFIRKAIANLTADMDWVPKEDFEKATNNTDDFEGWLVGKIDEQSEKTLIETPAFTVAQIQKKVEKIVDAVKLISKRPKPAPPAEKKKGKKKKGKKKKKEGETDEDVSDSTGEEGEKTEEKSEDDGTTEVTEEEKTEEEGQDDSTEETENSTEETESTEIPEREEL